MGGGYTASLPYHVFRGYTAFHPLSFRQRATEVLMLGDWVNAALFYAMVARAFRASSRRWHRDTCLLLVAQRLEPRRMANLSRHG
jgi:hypothetical protein